MRAVGADQVGTEHAVGDRAAIIDDREDHLGAEIDALAQDDIDAEELDLEEESKGEDMWPVVSLSLSIQFF